MKKEIKINNSKLKLVQYENYSYGCTEIILDNKKNLKYQYIVLTDKTRMTGELWTTFSTIGVKKIKITPSVHNYSSAWGLEKSSELYKSDREYTTDELMIVITYIASLIKYEYLDTAELLIQSINDQKISHEFYKMYGKKGIRLFIGFLNNIIDQREYNITKLINKFPKIYSNYSRYSISRLIDELIEGNAEILVDTELIGKIQRISTKTIDSNSTQVEYKTNEWAKITGLIGNMSRANLSLGYNTKISIDIPQNNVGIDPGKKICSTRQSICLVKDGLLNQSLIGVKISSKLAGKLKRLGLVRAELIYSGEYLLDISDLPVIDKCNLRGISSYYLSKLEVKYRLAVIANEYLQIYYPEDNKESPQKEFLKGLGIIGDYYYPTKKTSKSNDPTTTYYTSNSLVSTVIGLPTERKERLKKYIGYRKNTLSNFDPLKVFLDSLEVDKKPIESIREEWKVNLYKYNNELRDRKFQIIMSKITRFSDSGRPFIEDTVKTVVLKPEVTVKVKWSFKKVNNVSHEKSSK